MSDNSAQIPQTAEGMIPKTEIIPAIQAAGLNQDIVVALETWLTEQPGDSVPQEVFMLQLAEMAEIESHMANTMSDLADEVQNLADETQRLDDRAGIAELKIERDALAQIQQYATTAEHIVTAAEAQARSAQAAPVQITSTSQTPDVTA